ncbi:MAG: HlyD family secretion protein [Ferrimicrobium sp.]
MSLIRRPEGLIEPVSDTDVIDITDSALGNYQVLRTGEILPIKGGGVRLSHRAWLIGGAALLVGVGAIAGLIASAEHPVLTNLTAEVTNSGEVPLAFPQTGVLTSLLVKPGQSVHAGQVVAQESVPGLSQTVSLDRSILQSDEQEAATLNSIFASEGSAVSTSMAIASADYGRQVTAARQALATTESSQASATASFNLVVSQAQSLLTADLASQATTCAGVVPATTGVAPTTSQLACIDATHRVAQDQLSLTDARAAAATQQSQQSDWIAEEQRLLQDAEATAAGPLGSTAAPLASIQADLAGVTAEITQAKATLASDSSRVGAQNLVAPVDGKVIAVSGSVGEIAGQSGVFNAAPSGGSVAVTPSFQLFPASQSQSSQVGSLSSPVVVLQGSGQTTISVLVPESQIGLVHTGARVTFTPSVASLKVLQGTVSQIFPHPTIAAGAVSYEVEVSVPAAAARGYLDGVTGTASIVHR